MVLWVWKEVRIPARLAQLRNARTWELQGPCWQGRPLDQVRMEVVALLGFPRASFLLLLSRHPASTEYTVSYLILSSQALAVGAELTPPWTRRQEQPGN